MTESSYTPPPPVSEPPSAKEELKEAVGHFVRAAGLALEQASKDPTVRVAKDSAAEALRRLSERAEPVGRQALSVTTAVAGETGRALLSAAGRLTERWSTRPASPDVSREAGETAPATTSAAATESAQSPT